MSRGIGTEQKMVLDILENNEWLSIKEIAKRVRAMKIAESSNGIPGHPRRFAGKGIEIDYTITSVGRGLRALFRKGKVKREQRIIEQAAWFETGKRIILQAQYLYRLSV